MPRLKPNYVVFVHRLYAGDQPKLGGLDYLLEYFLEQNKQILLVESPLYPKSSPKITVKVLIKGSSKVILSLHFPYKNEYVIWFCGIVVDLIFGLIFCNKKCVTISSDPLSSVPAIILRKIGLCKYHYFHCTDYSDVRFVNSKVNILYRHLLRLSIWHADLVGCVSMRIKQKITDYKHKRLIYIPNSPDFYKFSKLRKPIESRRKNALVLTCAGISERYKILETVQLAYELSHEFKDIKLQIIGKIDLNPTYYKKVEDLINTYKFHTNVEMLGYMDREVSSEHTSSSYIGLAFYSRHDTYSWYSDPLKIREYAALGIPCVADLVTSAADEMQASGAGFAVEDIPAAYGKIKLLLSDQKVYENCSLRALAWAKKCDKNMLAKNLMENYLEK